jgi:hypothetical protein
MTVLQSTAAPTKLFTGQLTQTTVSAYRQLAWFNLCHTGQWRVGVPYRTHEG